MSDFLNLVLMVLLYASGLLIWPVSQIKWSRRNPKLGAKLFRIFCLNLLAIAILAAVTAVRVRLGTACCPLDFFGPLILINLISIGLSIRAFLLAKRA